LLLSLFFGTINSVPSLLPAKPAVRKIYEFPNETWIENIAIRSNGNLLLSLFNVPQLYELDMLPLAPSSAKLLHTFPFTTGLAGIAEIQPDVFAVLAGNWSLETFSTTLGSWSAWKVDFHRGNENVPAISKIADLMKASFADGMTLLAPESP
jgi:hypothetical protein